MTMLKITNVGKWYQVETDTEEGKFKLNILTEKALKWNLRKLFNLSPIEVGKVIYEVREFGMKIYELKEVA